MKILGIQRGELLALTWHVIKARITVMKQINLVYH